MDLEFLFKKLIEFFHENKIIAARVYNKKSMAVQLSSGKIFILQLEEAPENFRWNQAQARYDKTRGRSLRQEVEHLFSTLRFKKKEG